jgi:hypothetical protein
MSKNKLHCIRIEFAQDRIQELKDLGYNVDCYSVKGDGAATKNCDIAIDIRCGKLPIPKVGQAETFENPYGCILATDRDADIVRLTFVLL